MLIQSWMTKDVITLTTDRSMMKASKLMKDNGIKRLPIVDGKGNVVGIVTDRDIKEASPSKATTLDMHELYYLLSEIKVADIMTKNPVTVRQGDTVEKAAVLMHEKRIGGLPVVDDDGKLVGIITDSDVFRVLIQITGVLFGGVQFGVELSTAPGTVKPILEYLAEKKARIVSILTSLETKDDKTRHMFFRIMEMDKSDLKQIRQDLESNYNVLYWTRDSVHTLIP